MKNYNPEKLKEELILLQASIAKIYAQILLSTKADNQDIWLGMMQQKVKRRRKQRALK